MRRAAGAVRLALEVWLALALGLAAAPALAFQVEGVSLGASEADIRRAFPSAYCKPLEWESRAADRRCDDARIRFGGVEARVTFFLRADALEGFELRFASRDRSRLEAYLRSKWGDPSAQSKQLIQRKGSRDYEAYKMNWAKAQETAVLLWRSEYRRAWLRVSRGDFASEIYRVR